MKLAEAFNSKEARFAGTFSFVDMCDSTALKEQGEATWIPTTAWLYDTRRCGHRARGCRSDRQIFGGLRG
jgi:hypothetical protein